MKNLFILLLIIVSQLNSSACIETQTSGDFTVTTERLIANDTFTYKLAVTNTGSKSLNYLAATLPAGETGLFASSNIGGNIDNPTTSPFYGIKFKAAGANPDTMFFEFRTVTEIDDLAIQIKAANITSDFTFLNCGATLPVELSYFTGSQKGDKVELFWRTESETNNRFFDVMEIVGDGESFVQRVDGAGNSTQAQHYDAKFRPSSNGLKYYVLIQVDFDGTESRSDIVAINFNTAKNDILRVVPNLIQKGDAARLMIQGELSNNLYAVTVTDINGQHVARFKGTVANQGETNEIEIGGLDVSGVYFITLRAVGMLPVVKRFVIQ